MAFLDVSSFLHPEQSMTYFMIPFQKMAESPGLGPGDPFQDAGFRDQWIEPIILALQKWRKTSDSNTQTLAGDGIQSRWITIILVFHM